jgi:cytochrome subunit of sulfide dehydrogenase
MYATRLWVAAAIFCALQVAALAGVPEPPPGASSCSGCHAANPNVDTAVPSLIGRSAAGIVEQFQAFKSGARPGTVMDRIAKGFTDSEIAAVAAWYFEQQ